MTPFRKLACIACALFASMLPLATHAQGKIEKPKVSIAVGGKSGFYYLPLTIAERLNYFKEEGLDVEISDFDGGSKALQAVVGGSADVVSGAWENTIDQQPKGLNMQGFVLQGRYPAISVGIAKSKAATYKSPKDLKGMKIGVSAPGSSTNFFVNALIARDGVKPDEVSIIGVGTGLSAVAAMKKGEIDAIVNLDPVMTKLDQDGDIVILADSRTDEGNMKLFGGNNPAAVVYLKTDFISKNPVTVQHLVNAFYKATKWLEKATPEDIVKTVPEEYFLGDKALYLSAFKASKPMYSTTGIITPQGMQNGLNLLLQFDPEMKDARIDLNRTFDDRFVKKAAAGQM